MISVIIPAHNEERVIGQCLDALLAGAEAGELEVIVACNGCSDRTAEIAAGVGGPVRVVSTPVASKREALNLGDAAATAFPRIYLDADVGLTLQAARDVAAHLETGPALVAAPALSVDTSGSSPLVRSYYRVYCALPSVRRDVVGRGVYALSRAGRERFAEFPDLTGDDAFIRSLFSPEERGHVATATSRVAAPRSFGALVRRKVRIVAGNAEVDRHGAGPEANRGVSGLIQAVRGEPSLVVHLPAYVLVAVAARILARRSAAGGSEPAWSRDDSRTP